MYHSLYILSPSVVLVTENVYMMIGSLSLRSPPEVTVLSL